MVEIARLLGRSILAPEGDHQVLAALRMHFPANDLDRGGVARVPVLVSRGGPLPTSHAVFEGKGCGACVEEGPPVKVRGWRHATLDPHPLRQALDEALALTGLLPLHASAAAAEGGAVLFLADSGVGKSTTLMHALSQGWAPVAEDTVWLDARSLMVTGGDAAVRLLPDSASLLKVPCHALELAADGKFRVPYDLLGQRSVVAPVGAVVLLTREEWMPAGLVQAGGREAFLGILGALPCGKSAEVREAVLKTARRLATAFPVLRLNLAGEPPDLIPLREAVHRHLAASTSMTW
jgi:hypothetical protein